MLNDDAMKVMQEITKVPLFLRTLFLHKYQCATQSTSMMRNGAGKRLMLVLFDLCMQCEEWCMGQIQVSTTTHSETDWCGLQAQTPRHGALAAEKHLYSICSESYCFF